MPTKSQGSTPPVGSDYVRIGFWDYNDLATATTPLVCTVAGNPTKLTNDGAGAFTNKTYKLIDVAEIWDASSMEFDWSELQLGDMVDIRLDFDLVTTSPNTEINVKIRLGSGGGIYTIPFLPETNYKSAGTHNINVYNGIYMGDTNTIDGGGAFELVTDTNCTVKVNGWYAKVIRRV